MTLYDLLRSVDTIGASVVGLLYQGALADGSCRRWRGVIDLTVQLKLLNQRRLVAQGLSDEIPEPIIHSSLARVGDSHVCQIVVMHQRPFALDGHLAPEVVDPAGRGLCVLKENYGLIDHRGDKGGGIFRLGLVVRDDGSGQSAKCPPPKLICCPGTLLLAA